MFNNWEDLDYWQSGEWQVVEEHLEDYKARMTGFCPRKQDLFKALDVTPFDKVKVIIIGQDPYPNKKYATGLAFSIPRDIPKEEFPGSLVNIFNEYTYNLGIPSPKHGDLSWWAKQGVLLWNAYPSCEEGKPGSHHWTEWTYLTKEIVERLDRQSNIVFVLLGKHAQEYEKHIQSSTIIKTSHPSPMGAKHGFLGSRIFTRINVELIMLDKEPVDWRLE